MAGNAAGHVRSAPFHLEIQGTIERRHAISKNVRQANTLPEIF
jgi:hypothetical protein